MRNLYKDTPYFSKRTEHLYLKKASEKSGAFFIQYISSPILSISG